MRTLVQIFSVLLLLGTAACGNADNDAAVVNDNTAGVTAGKTDVPLQDEQAIARRSTRVDPIANCIRQADAETWQQLSMTTDQIRWVEELQGRMRQRNEDVSASVNKEVSEPARYTFNTEERRRLAEILTDEQLEKWMEMCR